MLRSTDQKYMEANPIERLRCLVILIKICLTSLIDFAFLAEMRSNSVTVKVLSETVVKYRSYLISSSNQNIYCENGFVAAVKTIYISTAVIYFKGGEGGDVFFRPPRLFMNCTVCTWIHCLYYMILSKMVL